MKRLPWILGLLALGGFLTLLALWRPWATDTSGGAAGADNLPEVSGEGQSNDGATVPRLRPFDPAGSRRTLPPPGPIAELATSADNGNARAACQLAAELSHCRTQQYFYELHPPGHVVAPSTRCTELLTRHLGRHDDWLRQAAHAGEPEAMLRYAIGEGFGLPGASFEYLRSPGFETWRREASAMLQTLVEAGYYEAVIYRIMANQPQFGGPMANLLPADPVQDQAYNELFLLLNGRSPLREMMSTRLRSGVDAEVSEKALQLATRWHQDYFGGRSVDWEALKAEGGTSFPAMRAHGATCSTPVDEALP